MARKTPYTFFLAFIDIILTFASAGAWLLVVLVRELYKRQSNRSKPYTVFLAICDVSLTVLTGGLWLIAMLFREMLRRK